MTIVRKGHGELKERAEWLQIAAMILAGLDHRPGQPDADRFLLIRVL